MFVNSRNRDIVISKHLVHDFIVYLTGSILKDSLTQSVTFHYFTNAMKNLQFFFLIYVDNILITNSDQEVIATLFHLLNQKFPIWDLGNARFLLSIELLPCSKGYLLSQSKYVSGLLQQVKTDDAHPIFTLIVEGGFSASSSSPTIVDHQIYQSTIGALQYITIT